MGISDAESTCRASPGVKLPLPQNEEENQYYNEAFRDVNDHGQVVIDVQKSHEVWRDYNGDIIDYTNFGIGVANNDGVDEQYVVMMLDVYDGVWYNVDGSNYAAVICEIGSIDEYCVEGPHACQCKRWTIFK